MFDSDLVMGFIETLESLRRYRRWSRNRPQGIRHNEMMLLLFLNHNLQPDCRGIQPSELGEMLRLTRPTITSLVNSLEEKGYVARLDDEEDRRVVLVRLTASGKELVQENQREFFKSVSEIMEYLGEEDARELIRLMERMRCFLERKKANSDGRTDECGD